MEYKNDGPFDVHAAMPQHDPTYVCVLKCVYARVCACMRVLKCVYAHVCACNISAEGNGAPDAHVNYVVVQTGGLLRN